MDLTLHFTRRWDTESHSTILWQKFTNVHSWVISLLAIKQRLLSTITFTLHLNTPLLMSNFEPQQFRPFVVISRRTVQRSIRRVTPSNRLRSRSRPGSR